MPYKRGTIWNEATDQMLDMRQRGEPDRCFYPGKRPSRPANCKRTVIVVEMGLAIPLPYCRRHWPGTRTKSEGDANL